MQSLFEHAPAVIEAPPEPAGPFAAVAIEQSVDRILDYSIPPRFQLIVRVGQRVRVPLGRNNKPAFGYVISISPTSEYPKIKPLLAVADERVLINPPLMELARWMSRYYCTPLGVVLESIIPSAVKKRTGLGYRQVVRLACDRAHVQELVEQTKARKRRAVLAQLLLIEPEQAVELHVLAAAAGTTVATVRKLVGQGLIRVDEEPDLEGLTDKLVSAAKPQGGEGMIDPNEDQQRVLDDLLPRLSSGGFSVNLLYGVTGSGKTEIYLRAIEETIVQGRNAIVLVPEIALTSQTVHRFSSRFSNVAVLHSGLTASQRHRFWQQVATGQAQVVVGARSAVFAPQPYLGLIVVDEEHESSYKQDTAPRYHARDVAIKRAQLEGAAVLLGSATPSLEMWRRVQGTKARRHEGTKEEEENPYHLLTLPRRVRGLAMPRVELIDMKQEQRFRRGVHLLGQRLERLLRETLGKGQQAILLLNRRGYSSFVYCASCQEPIHCRYCDATMTYHRSAGADGDARIDGAIHTGQLHCHYCLAVNPLPATCPTCGKKLTLFGLGTQRVEEELTRKFPGIRFARVDSDTMRSGRDYEALLSQFAAGEIQVMLGTQMIAKGLDYPNVTLVGVISGDTALSLPDFRAAERTFQLITQAAGRAGRGEQAGHVVLQTFLPDDPAIQCALKQDFDAFARSELPHRRQIGLPPFARMVRIILRDQEPEKLHRRAEELAARLTQAAATEQPAVQIKGPMPCPIARIANYHRYQIIMISPRAAALQRVLATLRTRGDLARSARIAVDVDPVSLL